MLQMSALSYSYSSVHQVHECSGHRVEIRGDSQSGQVQVLENGKIIETLAFSTLQEQGYERTFKGSWGKHKVKVLSAAEKQQKNAAKAAKKQDRRAAKAAKKAAKAARKAQKWQGK